MPRLRVDVFNQLNAHYEGIHTVQAQKENVEIVHFHEMTIINIIMIMITL
jgi:hypothetical protein